MKDLDVNYISHLGRLCIAYEHMSIKQFNLVIFELQSTLNQPLIEESASPNEWQNACLLGAGRKFTIGKRISLSTMLLYDFNHKNNELSRRPWVPRIGYIRLRFDKR